MERELDHIERCIDLREDDIARAVVSREDTRGLLAHLAACSAPDTGAAKVLFVFARMATTACGWIDGDLVIDLVKKEAATVVHVATDLGGGLRERLLPSLTVHAPLSEFKRAVDRAPHLIVPLSIHAKDPQRVVLSATATVRRTSLPPAPIAIAGDHLFAPVAPPVPTAAMGPAVPPVLPLVSQTKAESSASRSASDPPVEAIDSGWDD